MGTQEFYIRAPAETESHGPYTLEQLVALAEAGRIDAQSLYYDATSERWTTLVHNPDLKALLFPEKKKLVLRPKEAVIPTEVETDDPKAQLNVEEMLAAAEGRTDETKDKRNHSLDYEKNAAIGRQGAIVLLLISAGALTLPHAEAITTFDLKELVTHPESLLGLADLGLALLLLLGMTDIYPVVRFRAALGVGFFAMLGWLDGNYLHTLAVAAGAVGLFLSTIFLHLPSLIGALLLGFVGMAAFAYLSLAS